MKSVAADLASIRIVVESIAEECELQAAEVGPLAQLAMIDATTCRAIMAMIDLGAAARTATREVPELPERLKRSLDDYRQHGLRTGDCLYAVLCNDMRGAFSRADAETTAAMPAILAYIDACLPCVSWGTKEAVDAWLRRWCA